jgi:hypothetical protein
MNTYLVRWELHVDGETPEEAAAEALRIHRDPESEATIFEVLEPFEDDGVVPARLAVVDAETGERLDEETV